MKLSPAEIDLHNEITSAVEAHTHNANLATAIADQAITEALVPTAQLLRHLADQFDKETAVTCPVCRGHGANPMSDNVNWLPCTECHGSGKVLEATLEHIGFQMWTARSVGAGYALRRIADDMERGE